MMDKVIDFIVNGIGDEGATMISEALTINRTLKKLALKSKWDISFLRHDDCKDN